MFGIFGRRRSPAEQAREFLNRGWSEHDKGNLDKAIADFSKAVELNSKYAEAYKARGVSYAQQGNLDQAIADFNKAVELDPEYTSVYFSRGNAYRGIGNFDQAIADFNKAIELDPKYTGAYFNRGNAYQEIGNLDQAIADYSGAIELDPQFAHAYSLRGLAYHYKDNFDQAIADYSKVIELDPKFATVYYNRGNACLQKGLHSQAITDFERTITSSATLPPRETMPPEFLAELESIASSDRQWNIVAIGMTEFRAFMANPYFAVPFLNFLHGFVQIGHAVILFEGHSSALAAVCRNADLLIVDGEMIPFLQTDWLEVVRSVMRTPNILRINRKGNTILGTEKIGRNKPQTDRWQGRRRTV